jgi:23S rRNA (pseudouridine1915-N3)-methyltransferase
MKITLITVGTLKEDYLRRAMEEYVRRIGAYATWEEINLKEEKLKDESPASVDTALKAEGERIVAAIPKDALAIALCVEGKQYSSEELAALLGRGADEKGKVCLVIGSSWGLSEEVKRACHVRLSVSKMTFPHQLMRVILGEAIYRSLTILKGKKYHK